MLADLFCVGLANPREASLGSGRGNRFRSTTGLPGDLLVFRASGSVRVFVDQSAQDRFSADLLCVYAGHGGARSVRFAVGDALGDALVRAEL